MGYMGLNHWGESDEAADFVISYRKAKNAAEREKLIDKELKNSANEYNTSGSINIALAIEDGIVRGEDVSKKQLKKLIELLEKEKKSSSIKFKKKWNNESNRIMHNDAHRRLLSVIKKL